MVTLHNANTPELRNFNRFMTVLCHRFEGPLVGRKVRECKKTIWQCHTVMAEYIEDFYNLAYRLNWPEDILISCFKDGLNNDLYNACVAFKGPIRVRLY